MILVIILAHILLLSRLAFLPYPELFVYPYLTNHGLLPYAQILDQHFPGLMFLPVNLNNLGMTTPDIARLWQYGIVVVTQIILYKVSVKIFKSKLAALSTSLIYLVWQPVFEGWVLWIDSFLPIFYLSSLYFLLKAFDREKAKDYILAGLFLGIATVFKQIVIPLTFLVVLFIFIRKRNIKQVFYFLVGYLPLPALMTLYMAVNGLFADFWYWTVTYNLTVFAKFGRKFSTLNELNKFALAFVPSAFLIISRKTKYYLVLLFMVGALIAAYARFDFVHLQPSLVFAVIGIVYAFIFIAKHKWYVLGFAYVGLMAVVVFKFYRSSISDKVYFFGQEEYSLASKVGSLTSPGDKIFVYGSTPNLYPMTGTLPAGNVFVFQFPWFTMLTEGRLLDGIKRDKPVVVVEDRTVTIEGVSLVDYTSDIDSYISDNYTEVDRVGANVILQRKNEN